MQSTNAPGKLTLPFAASGNKNTIPVPSQIPILAGAASWTDGFPPLTMTAVTAGGVPPSGLDMNGVLNAISALALWYGMGAGFPYDSNFAQAIGGYPKGARVLRADGAGYWFSTAENNSTNPDTGGAGWSTGQIAPAQNPVSSVYASGQQTLPAGTAKIIFDSVEFDAGLWDTANKRFVASAAGKYRVTGAVLLSAPSGQSLATEIWHNGVLAKQCLQMPQVSTTDLTMPFDAIIQMATGDYVEPHLTVGQTAVIAGSASVSNQSLVFAQCEYLGS